MSELERIEALEREIRELKGLNNERIASYSFSQIKLETLKNLVDINHNFNNDIFIDWFSFSFDINDEIINFLNALLDKESRYIKYYNEENLKIKFLSPILNHINFDLKDQEVKDFYESKIMYKNEKFILEGTADFTVSKGNVQALKPYFFIQEFKKGKINTDPEPQLLAELISAIELNNETSMRGAYIVGAIWNFVILEKLGKDKYQYFVSENFDSTKIVDLKGIYCNLIFVKEEIIEMIKKENE